MKRSLSVAATVRTTDSSSGEQTSSSRPNASPSFIVSQRYSSVSGEPIKHIGPVEVVAVLGRQPPLERGGGSDSQSRGQRGVVQGIGHFAHLRRPSPRLGRDAGKLIDVGERKTTQQTRFSRQVVVDAMPDRQPVR